MRLCHSQDGSTYPRYKRMCFVCNSHCFHEEQSTLAFYRTHGAIWHYVYRWCFFIIWVLLCWVWIYWSRRLVKSVFILPACLPGYLSACLPVCQSACLPVCLSVCLSACLPVCLSACWHACLPAETTWIDFKQFLPNHFTTYWYSFVQNFQSKISSGYVNKAIDCIKNEYKVIFIKKRYLTLLRALFENSGRHVFITCFSSTVNTIFFNDSAKII